jgi:hypothetical protein
MDSIYGENICDVHNAAPSCLKIHQIAQLATALNHHCITTLSNPKKPAKWQ